MSKIIYATEDNFKNEVLLSNKPVLVDFWATWCGPCKMIAPILEEISNEREDLKIVKVDVDENETISQQFGIRSIPTLYLFKDGEIIASKAGASSKSALISWIEENI